MKPAPVVLPNQPATAALSASTATVTLPCGPDQRSQSGGCPATANTTVGLTTTASDPDGDTLLYSYTVTGGRVTGEGASVSWDLSGVGLGTYTASVEVDDGCGCITSSTTTVTVANCPDCVPNLVCGTVSISGADSAEDGSPITFHATYTRGTPVTPMYNWSVSAGTITSGQGTDSITVDTKGTAGQTIRATVEVGGLDPSCPRTDWTSTAIYGLPPRPSPTPFVTPSPQPSPGTRFTQPDKFPVTGPTPNSTPNSQPTPCSSPTPVPKDFIEITYPDYLLANNGESEVEVTLDTANGRSERQPEQPGAVRRFFRWLGALFGKAPSPSTQAPVQGKVKSELQDWCTYDGFAKARIEKPANLELTPGEGNDGDGYQSLDSDQPLRWVWHVKGSRTSTTQLKIRLYIWWKSKVSGVPDKRPNEVWPNDGRVFQVTVQEPTIWNLAMSITSWLVAGLGTTLMSIFIGPWIKRRLRPWIRRFT